MNTKAEERCEKILGLISNGDLKAHVNEIGMAIVRATQGKKGKIVGMAVANSQAWVEAVRSLFQMQPCSSANNPMQFVAETQQMLEGQPTRMTFFTNASETKAAEVAQGVATLVGWELETSHFLGLSTGAGRYLLWMGSRLGVLVFIDAKSTEGSDRAFEEHFRKFL
jgi:hypothetical protein